MTTLTHPTLTDGLVLDHVRLGLDPADLDFIVEDDNVVLAAADGPLLTLYGWLRTDADQIRQVADWFDALAEVAVAAATELRRYANSLCEDCDGHGLVGDDADCRACSGTGTVS